MNSNKEKDARHFHYFNVEGTRYRTNFTNKFNKREPWVPKNPNLITALIPGTLLKITVKEGQKVSEGKCLYVLEAMKMKNRFTAPKAGIVAKIHAKEGEILPRGFLIMELSEPEPKTRSHRSKTRSK